MLWVEKQRQEDKREREEIKACFGGNWKAKERRETCCEAVFSATTKTHDDQITVVNEMR